MRVKYDPDDILVLNKDFANLVKPIAEAIHVCAPTPLDGHMPHLSEGRAERLRLHLHYYSGAFGKDAYFLEWLNSHDGTITLLQVSKLRGVLACAEAMLIHSRVRRAAYTLLLNPLCRTLARPRRPADFDSLLDLLQDPLAPLRLENNPFFEYVQSPTRPAPPPLMLVDHIMAQWRRGAYDLGGWMANLPVYQRDHHQRGSVDWAHCLAVALAALSYRHREDPATAIMHLCLSIITARGSDRVDLIRYSLAVMDQLLATYDEPPAHFKAARDWHLLLTRHFATDIGRFAMRQRLIAELKDFERQLGRLLVTAPDDCVTAHLIEVQYDCQYRLAEYIAHDPDGYDKAFQIAYDVTTAVEQAGPPALIGQGGLTQLKICVGNGDYKRAELVIGRHDVGIGRSAPWRQHTWGTGRGLVEDYDHDRLTAAWMGLSNLGLRPHTDSAWDRVVRPDLALESVSKRRQKGRGTVRHSIGFGEMRRGVGLLRRRQKWPTVIKATTAEIQEARALLGL